MVTTFFTKKIYFYYLNDKKNQKNGKITQFYINVCPFQKWTFLKCPIPKKIPNNFLLFFSTFLKGFILL